MTSKQSTNEPSNTNESTHVNVLGMDGGDLTMMGTAAASSTNAPSASPPSSNALSTLTSASASAIAVATTANSPGTASSPRRKRQQQQQQHQKKKHQYASVQGSDSSPDTHESSSSSGGAKSWLGSVLWGDGSQRRDDDEADDASLQYHSLEHASETASQFSHRPPAPAGPPTKEDELKESCTFFYKGVESPPKQGGGGPNNNNNNNRRGLQPLSSALHQIPRLMNREGQRFQARYRQLNQEIAPQAPSTDDLWLDEDDNNVDASNGAGALQSGIALGPPRGALRTASNLCYEQNGRLLMRLPRDHVRLIMDQDLEPGIISVEQWRDEESARHFPFEFENDLEAMNTLEDHGTAAAAAAGTVNMDKRAPPLHYVLTVPDDLYRRVVAEMSFAHHPPCGGCLSNGDGRADIRLALLILGVTLSLMFISTMYWLTE